MRNPNFRTNGEERPAVDEAERAVGHPHTGGVEFTDYDASVEFGEDPDVETHIDEGQHDI